MRHLATFLVCTIVVGVSALAGAQDEHRQILRDKFQNGLEEIVGAYEGVAGIHIIDLTDGSRFAVSDELVFPQASAIKVPILLELFRRAEAEPGLLSKRIEMTDKVRTAGLLADPERLTDLRRLQTSAQLHFRLPQLRDDLFRAVLLSGHPASCFLRPNSNARTGSVSGGKVRLASLACSSTRARRLSPASRSTHTRDRRALRFSVRRPSRAPTPSDTDPPWIGVERTRGLYGPTSFLERIRKIRCAAR